MSTFREVTNLLEENADLKERVASQAQTIRDLTAERDVLAELATGRDLVAHLTAERDLLAELANARDVADYRAWLAEDVTP